MFLPGVTCLTGITRSCGGLWNFLIVRVRGQTAVELERERNRATAAVITLLPPGAELLENEPGGRLRAIRMPPGQSAQFGVIHDVAGRRNGELPR